MCLCVLPVKYIRTHYCGAYVPCRPSLWSFCIKEISEMLCASGMVGRFTIYLFTVPVVTLFLYTMLCAVVRVVSPQCIIMRSATCQLTCWGRCAQTHWTWPTTTQQWSIPIMHSQYGQRGAGGHQGRRVLDLAQVAFFGIRVFHPSAPSYQKKEISAVYRLHENAKKRKWCQGPWSGNGSLHTTGFVYNRWNGTGVHCVLQASGWLPGLQTWDKLLPGDDLAEMQNLICTTEIHHQGSVGILKLHYCSGSSGYPIGDQ